MSRESYRAIAFTLQQMRAVAHLGAVLLLVPQALVWAAFVLLDHLTAGGSLGSLVENAFDVLNVLFGWGGLALIVAFVSLIAAAFHPRSRFVAAVVVIVFAIYSSVELMRSLGTSQLADAWPWFLPAVVAVALEAWNVHREMRVQLVPST